MQPIHIYNTLTSKKDIFVPQEPGKIKMYVCGITPYDESHLGHARCYLFFDTVKRFFIHSGFQVTHVQNFTDIDDKIIARSKNTGQSSEMIANQFIESYFTQMKRLNILPADIYPRVTQTVPAIIEFIQKLISRKCAYVSDGNVFYSVRKFASYGKLSKKTLNELEAGARVEVDERKNDPLDFALWKKTDSDPAWDSPWGPGRPGWHIECSVMSINHLGESFDIHGGGQDLIFPHHENEIAQSEGLTQKPFAKYWMHNGFVTVNREKMSKSLGNFFTLKDIFEKFSPETVRFFLLSRHYKSPLDFSDDLLVQSRSALQSLNEINDMAFFLTETEANAEPLLEDWKKSFWDVMSDDFNTEKAAAVIFQLRSQMIEKINAGDREWLKRARNTLLYLCGDLLGVHLNTTLTKPQIQEMKIKLKKREEFRKAKDWKNADVIRNEILNSGYLIEDTPQGPVVKSKPNF